MLFGERMRLAGAFEFEVIWTRVYGDIAAQVRWFPDKLEGDPHRYRYSFANRYGYADTLAAAVHQLESLIRRTGRALPAAALVSRKEWQRTNG